MSSSQNTKYLSFTCHCAPNGGWVLEHHDGRAGLMSTLIGAFSSSYDMLKFIEERATPNGLEIEPQEPRKASAGGVS